MQIAISKLHVGHEPLTHTRVRPSLHILVYYNTFFFYILAEANIWGAAIAVNRKGQIGTGNETQQQRKTVRNKREKQYSLKGP